VILDDVAQRAGFVIVAAARADADCLRDGDLDVIDVVAVPQRLKDRVGEPEHSDILDGLFAKIVIDAVNLVSL